MVVIEIKQREPTEPGLPGSVLCSTLRMSPKTQLRMFQTKEIATRNIDTVYRNLFCSTLKKLGCQKCQNKHLSTKKSAYI